MNDNTKIDGLEIGIAALDAKPFAIKAGMIFARNGAIYWSLYGALRRLGEEIQAGADPESAIDGWLSDTAHWLGARYPQLTRLDVPMC